MKQTSAPPSPSKLSEWGKYTGRFYKESPKSSAKASFIRAFFKPFQYTWGVLTGSFPNAESSLGLRISVYLCELTSLAAVLYFINKDSFTAYAGLLTCSNLLAFLFLLRRSNSCFIKLFIFFCLFAACLSFEYLPFTCDLLLPPCEGEGVIAILLSGLLLCHSIYTPRRCDLDFSLIVSLLLFSCAADMSASLKFIYPLAAYFVLIVSALYFRSLSRTEENSVTLDSKSKKPALLMRIAQSVCRSAVYLFFLICLIGIIFICLPRFENLDHYKPQHSADLNNNEDNNYKDNNYANDSQNSGGKERLSRRNKTDSFIYFAESEDLHEVSSGSGSDRLIMKVKASRQTYYRGRAFSRYDGHKWSPGKNELTECSSDTPIKIDYDPDNPYFDNPLVQIYYIEADIYHTLFSAFQPCKVFFSGGNFNIDNDRIMKAQDIIKAGSVYTVHSIPSYTKPYDRAAAKTPFVNFTGLPYERKALQYLKNRPEAESIDVDTGEKALKHAASIQQLDVGILLNNYSKTHDGSEPENGNKTASALKADTRFHYMPDIVRLEDETADKEFSEYLQLPPQISPRIKALAEHLTSHLSSQYMKALSINHFLRSNYIYQNPPPPCPSDREPVDYFLFESGKGNCRQFASAMTVLCRAAGLPARFITGFAPGSYNPVTMTYEVRDRDAHAWTEAMIPCVGWVAYETTSPYESESGSETHSENPVINSEEKSSINSDLRQYLLRLIPDKIKTAAAKLISWLELITLYKLLLSASAFVLYISYLYGLQIRNNIIAMKQSISYAKTFHGSVLQKLAALIKSWRVHAAVLNTQGKDAVSCYKLMLSILQQLNIKKSPSQTPREFAELVKSERLNDSVQALTELYGRAYYGAGPLNDAPEFKAAVDEYADSACEELQTVILETKPPESEK
ncbi:transglutaminase domain-containing protein [bacterium]|nr:transglutaminase domain-containing protein [bacterium]